MILGPKACSIPAWGNAPGLEIEELPRAVGPFHSVARRPAVPQRDCPGLQPSIHYSHETQGDALGCYGIGPLALKMENRTESFPKFVTRTRMGKRRGVPLPAALQGAGPSEMPVSFLADPIQAESAIRHSRFQRSGFASSAFFWIVSPAFWRKPPVFSAALRRPCSVFSAAVFAPCSVFWPAVCSAWPVFSMA